MKKDRIPSFGTPGAVSLLATFAILSIAIFAILVLSTCLSDSRRAETTYALTDSYYEADCQAETKIAELRKEGQTGVQEFSVPAGQNMELQVSVRISNDEVKVLKWKMVNTTEWEADESLNLIG